MIELIVETAVYVRWGNHRMQTLGERLKAVRRRLGISQEELAARSGVEQASLERGVFIGPEVAV